MTTLITAVEETKKAQNTYNVRALRDDCKSSNGCEKDCLMLRNRNGHETNTSFSNNHATQRKQQQYKNMNATQSFYYANPN